MPDTNASTRKRTAAEVPDVPCPLPFPYSVLGPLLSGVAVCYLYVVTRPEDVPLGEDRAIKAFLAVVALTPNSLIGDWNINGGQV